MRQTTTAATRPLLLRLSLLTVAKMMVNMRKKRYLGKGRRDMCKLTHMQQGEMRVEGATVDERGGSEGKADLHACRNPSLGRKHLLHLLHGP